MGMSTHVVGFKGADDKWREMKRVYETCEAAGVSIPDEVDDYFDGCGPGDSPGMDVDISDCVSDYEGEACSGIEVDITRLPPDVSKIRFFNAW